LAGKALKRGMIDAITDTTLSVVSSAKSTTAHDGGNQPEATKMDLKDLKSQHPDTFAAAVQQGVVEERDRVTAHLVMGESSGDIKTANASIRNGDAMTATLSATYMTFGMNRSDVNARDKDNLEANAGDAANTESNDDKGGDVVGLIEARLGLGV